MQPIVVEPVSHVQIGRGAAVWKTRRVKGSRNIVRYTSELQRADALWGSRGGRGELGEQPLQACVGCGHGPVADPRLNPAAERNSELEHRCPGRKCVVRGRKQGWVNFICRLQSWTQPEEDTRQPDKEDNNAICSVFVSAPQAITKRMKKRSHGNNDPNSKAAFPFVLL